MVCKIRRNIFGRGNANTSVSPDYENPLLRQALAGVRTLRDSLPDTVDIWVGGAGAHERLAGIPGVSVIGAIRTVDGIALRIHKARDNGVGRCCAVHDRVPHSKVIEPLLSTSCGMLYFVPPSNPGSKLQGLSAVLVVPLDGVGTPTGAVLIAGSTEIL